MEKGKKGGEEREAVQEKVVAELREPSPFQGCDLQCLPTSYEWAAVPLQR